MAAFLALLPVILRVVSALAALWGVYDAKTAIENSMAVGAFDIPSIFGALPSWGVAIASFAASFIKYNGGTSGTFSILSSVQTLLSGAVLSPEFQLSQTQITIPTDSHLIKLTVQIDPKPKPTSIPVGFRLVPVEPGTIVTVP